MNRTRLGFPRPARSVFSTWPNKTFFALWLGSVLTLGGISLLQAVILLRAGAAPFDFGTYYLVGRMVAKEPAAIYDVAAMQNYVTWADQEPSQAPYRVTGWAPYAYPPFFAVIMRPLSEQPFSVATRLWEGLNILWLVLSVPLLIYISGWQEIRLGSRRWLLLGLLVLLCFPPAHEVILLGQVNLILLFLIAASFALLHRGNAWRDGLAGALVGLAVAIKILPVVLLFYLLLRRRWIAVAGGAAAFLATLWVGAAGAGGWQAGWALTWNYFTIYLPGTFTVRFDYSLVGNQAPIVFFIRLLGNVPLARILGLVAVGLVVCITGIILLRRHTSSHNLANLLPEMALVSLLPLLVTSWVPSNYLVMALPPLAVLVGSANLSNSWFTSPRLKLSLAVYLLMSISSYAEGEREQLFYFVPFGLAGILILWGLLIHICSVHRQSVF